MKPDRSDVAAGPALSLRRRLTFHAVLALVLAILLGLGWLLGRSFSASAEADRWQMHTYLVINELTDLLSSLKDAETGQRGFIITGDPRFQEPYHTSLGEIETHLAALRQLTADNPAQQQRLAAVTPLVAAKLAGLKERIALRETQGFQAASEAVASGEGKAIMDELRVLLGQTQREEERLLQGRIATKEADTRTINLTVALGGLALLGLLSFLWLELTRRHRAESALRDEQQALRESEQRFRVFVSASSDVVYRMSADWRVMCQLHGQNFINDTTTPNAQWMDEYIALEDRAQVTAAIAEAIRTKSMFRLEHRVRRADASIGWTASQAVPLLGADGEIIEWFGTAKDVTAQKRAEAAMRAADARYASLFASIDEGFCIIDMLFDEQKRPIDYRFLEVNPAFERHTGLHHANGKRMLELHPDHEAHWFEIYGRVALSGEPIRFTHEARALDQRWFDVYAMRPGGPGSTKVALLFRDITAAKRRENDLRESNQELTVFNRVAVGRELRMIELKCEINALCARLGVPARFALAGEIAEPPTNNPQRNQPSNQPSNQA